MGYLLMQMFLYLLAALLLGLLLGWILWGRSRGAIGYSSAEVEGLQADNARLKAELAASTAARTDLDQRVQEASGDSQNAAGQLTLDIPQPAADLISPPAKRAAKRAKSVETPAAQIVVAPEPPAEAQDWPEIPAVETPAILERPIVAETPTVAEMTATAEKPHRRSGSAYPLPMNRRAARSPMPPERNHRCPSHQHKKPGALSPNCLNQDLRSPGNRLHLSRPTICAASSASVRSTSACFTA